jgi:hypothetical protein
MGDDVFQKVMDAKIRESMRLERRGSETRERSGSAAESEDEQVDDIDEEAVLKVLEGSEFFGGDEALPFRKFIFGRMTKVVFPNGEAIYNQGDEGDDAVILGSGSCLVEVGGTRVGEIPTGGLIGEAVVMGIATHRTATVRCVGEVVAYTLTRAAVLAAFEKFPAAEERVLKLAGIRAGVRQALAATEKKEETVKTGTKSGPKHRKTSLGDFRVGYSMTLPAAGGGARRNSRIGDEFDARRISGRPGDAGLFDKVQTIAGTSHHGRRRRISTRDVTYNSERGEEQPDSSEHPAKAKGIVTSNVHDGSRSGTRHTLAAGNANSTKRVSQACKKRSSSPACTHSRQSSKGTAKTVSDSSGEGFSDEDDGLGQGLSNSDDEKKPVEKAAVRPQAVARVPTISVLRRATQDLTNLGDGDNHEEDAKCAEECLDTAEQIDRHDASQETQTLCVQPLESARAEPDGDNTANSLFIPSNEQSRQRAGSVDLSEIFRSQEIVDKDEKVSDSDSCDGVAFATTKKTAHLEWASRRLDAIKAAPLRRGRRLAARDRLVPLLPPDCGYTVPSIRVAPHMDDHCSRRHCDERALEAELERVQQQLRGLEQSLVLKRADQQIQDQGDGRERSEKVRFAAGDGSKKEVEARIASDSVYGSYRAGQRITRNRLLVGTGSKARNEKPVNSTHSSLHPLQVQPWRLRLRKAKGVYGPPVWFADGASSVLPAAVPGFNPASGDIFAPLYE